MHYNLSHHFTIAPFDSTHKFFRNSELFHSIIILYTLFSGVLIADFFDRTYNFSLFVVRRYLYPLYFFPIPGMCGVIFACLFYSSYLWYNLRHKKRADKRYNDFVCYMQTNTRRISNLNCIFSRIQVQNSVSSANLFSLQV